RCLFRLRGSVLRGLGSHRQEKTDFGGLRGAFVRPSPDQQITARAGEPFSPFLFDTSIIGSQFAGLSLLQGEGKFMHCEGPAVVFPEPGVELRRDVIVVIASSFALDGRDQNIEGVRIAASDSPSL